MCKWNDVVNKIKNDECEWTKKISICNDANIDVDLKKLTEVEEIKQKKMKNKTVPLNWNKFNNFNVENW